MKKISLPGRWTRHLMLLSLLALMACGKGSQTTDATAGNQASDAVLTFQTSNESLWLPQLRVANEVYADVVLALRSDGSWGLQSVGERSAIAPGQSIDAELTTEVPARLDTSWRPDAAAIRIRRLHIDHRVMANVLLHVGAAGWRWDAGMEEVMALHMDDFAVNKRLAASDVHHVVLRSHPGVATQQFPLRLQERYYRFCSDPHDGPGDTFALTDSRGAQVVSFKAGDPCVSFRAKAETYTFTHVYGNAGNVATLFFRPAPSRTASPLLASARALQPQTFSLADQATYPEYWGVFVAGNSTQAEGGYLSVNNWYFTFFADLSLGPCQGYVDAAAQPSGYIRPGSTNGTQYLWDGAGNNFFKITRDANGNPINLRSTLACEAWAIVNRGAENAANYIGLDLESAPLSSGASTFSVRTGTSDVIVLSTTSFQNRRFTLSFNGRFFSTTDKLQGGFGDLVYVGFPYGFSGPDLFTLLNNDQLAYSATFPNLKAISFSTPPQTFQLDYRLFPKGLPPSMKKGDGTWDLAEDEIALFDGTGCSGKAIILAGDGRSTPLNGLNLFGKSMQLGGRASAVLHKTWGSTASDSSNMAIVNQSGCINGLNAPSGAWNAAQVTVSADAMTLLVSYNDCANCNLSGLQMNYVDSLKGVKLPNANLTGASFANSDLSGADLRNATLQGAKLNYTNLEGANFCGATLNNTSAAGTTSLVGAHLKNVNFFNANLDGAVLTYASFYSSIPGVCTPSDCSVPAVSSCANGNASWNKADLSNAYLSGADFSSARARSANFSAAVLFGARFTSAKLSRSEGSLSGANFSNAFLQGADFTSAETDYTQFSGAQFDQDTSNSCMQVALSNEYTGFRGFKTPDSSGLSCIVAPQAAPTCVQVSYGTTGVSRPILNATSSCPDGTAGPCIGWQSRVTPTVANSTCNASAPVCGSDPFLSPPPNPCW